MRSAARRPAKRASRSVVFGLRAGKIKATRASATTILQSLGVTSSEANVAADVLGTRYSASKKGSAAKRAVAAKKAARVKKGAAKRTSLAAAKRGAAKKGGAKTGAKKSALRRRGGVKRGAR